MYLVRIIKSYLLIFFIFISCSSGQQNRQQIPLLKDSITAISSLREFDENIIPAAHDMNAYVHLIKNKKLGLIVNHTSMLNQAHIVDTLLKLDYNIQKIFAPEHGFRGKADAGESVKDGIDLKTGIPLVSLYGKNKKPSPEQLKNIDILIFDIQDVGARFYTYTSTMTYVMMACAENDIPLLVLDRPNPNGHYVDGPILQSDQKSFVGMHPVPVVHGLTVGEYAKMINGEGWLGNDLVCDLHVARCINYDHNKFYELPVKPSPNLPDMHAIYLYPSLCLFEGTTVSVGRGTNKQFQIYGHPNNNTGNYSFIPTPHEGAAKPKHQDVSCKGFDLSSIDMKELQKIQTLNLEYISTLFKNLSGEDQKNFFLKNNFFDLLAGNELMQSQIKNEIPVREIRKSWEPELSEYKKMRKKYLLYKDFGD